ncbi:FAD-dependent oxidoreductase [Luteimonas sp. e5]
MRPMRDITPFERAAGTDTRWPREPEGGLCDVVVIGAGVVGVATAYAAARRGLSVQLIDQADGPALGASFANGGQLSYAYTDAMAGPSLWPQLPRIVAGRDPAFRMRLAGNPAIWSWGLTLLGNSTRRRMQRNTLRTLALAQESHDAMTRLLEKHPIDFAHAKPGKMHVYYSASALRASAAMVALKRQHGVNQTLLGPEQAVAIEPALAGVSGLAGVVYSPEEEVGDPHRFCAELLTILHRHYAVRACFGFGLKNMQPQDGSWTLVAHDGREIRGRRVIVCAGIDSAALMRPLGVKLPLMAVKGYSFTAPCGSNPPRASITDTVRKLVFCRLGDRMRVAGFADVGDWNPEPDLARVDQLVAMARKALPGAVDYTRIESHWAGLRPATPQSVPLIVSPAPGLVCNAGHGMLGWTLAMGSAERAVALAMGEESRSR